LIGIATALAHRMQEVEREHNNFKNLQTSYNSLNSQITQKNTQINTLQTNYNTVNNELTTAKRELDKERG
jgi:septal ring factor EnvC (AmiA/AmiB activator)